MKSFSAPWIFLFAAFLAQPVAFAQSSSNTNIPPAPGLSDTTILLIRHAEKPDTGFELSEAGRQRAQAYVKYFQTFAMDGKPAAPDYVFATADSKGSHRPRLTVEPFATASGLKIDSRFKNKNYQDLADEVRARSHGKFILIAWHHGEIPELTKALGADPSKLIPGGKWPEDTFNWVLQLRYDHDGRLAGATRVQENIMPGDAKSQAASN